jgi:hypothetical protein
MDTTSPGHDTTAIQPTKRGSQDGEPVGSINEAAKGQQNSRSLHSGQFQPTPRKDQVRDLDGSKLGNPSTRPVLRAAPLCLRSPLYEGANQKLVKRTAVLSTELPELAEKRVLPEERRIVVTDPPRLLPR